MSLLATGIGKNAVSCLYCRGFNAHLVRSNRPLEIKMAVWSTFFKFELLQTIMAVWRASY